MSVLIKGMEMPTCCCVCPCFNDEYCYCQTADKDLGSIPIDHRHPDCPLVSVPPHGRLIDADALSAKIIEIVEQQKYDDFYAQTLSVGAILREVVNDLKGKTLDGYANAPTVIPADKDGET